MEYFIKSDQSYGFSTTYLFCINIWSDPLNAWVNTITTMTVKILTISSLPQKKMLKPF